MSPRKILHQAIALLILIMTVAPPAMSQGHTLTSADAKLLDKVVPLFITQTRQQLASGAKIKADVEEAVAAEEAHNDSLRSGLIDPLERIKQKVALDVALPAWMRSFQTWRPMSRS